MLTTWHAGRVDGSDSAACACRPSLKRSPLAVNRRLTGPRFGGMRMPPLIEAPTDSAACACRPSLKLTRAARPSSRFGGMRMPPLIEVPEAACTRGDSCACRSAHVLAQTVLRFGGMRMPPLIESAKSDLEAIRRHTARAAMVGDAADDSAACACRPSLNGFGTRRSDNVRVRCRGWQVAAPRLATSETSMRRRRG